MISQHEELDSAEVYQPDWALWIRQFVAIGLVIAGVYALTLLSPVFSLIIATFLLSFLTYFPARTLAARTPLTYRVCVILVVALILLALVVLLVAIIPSIVDLFRGIFAGLYDLLERLRDSLVAWDPTSGGYSIRIVDTLSIDITPIASQIRAALVETDPQIAQQLARTAIIENMPPIDPGQILTTLARVVAGVIGAVSGFFTTLVMGLFLSLLILLELPNYEHRIMNSTPEDYLREIRLMGQKIMNVWQGFFRGQLLVCAIIGVLTLIQLVLMGVSGALPLALIVAAVSLIPTIGGFLALIPLGLVPLLQGSTVFTDMSNIAFALLVVGVNLIITQIIWNVVSPKIMGKAVSLPLPVIIIGVIIGAAVGGVLGAFLIVPILGTVRVIVFYLIAKVLRRDPFPGEMVTPTIELAQL
jgi:predicted PurR-regulated permease PerM